MKSKKKLCVLMPICIPGIGKTTVFEQVLKSKL